MTGCVVVTVCYAMVAPGDGAWECDHARMVDGQCEWLMGGGSCGCREAQEEAIARKSCGSRDAHDEAIVRQSSVDRLGISMTVDGGSTDEC